MSLSPSDQAARDALRARQGKGARYDAEGAPHNDLLLARRGAAYFARKLGELRDNELNAASLRAGWTRRQLIAHAGYHARALAHLVETARTGVEPAAPQTDADRRAEIDLGATLPDHALRGLVFHATIHLDVEWRDLTDDQWESKVVLQDGTEVSVSETPRIRAREVWQCAVDLDNGARLADLPAELEIS